VSHVVAALIGAVTAVASVTVHRSGIALLVVAALASVGVAWELRGTDSPRLGTSYCLGWLVVFGVAVAGRGEGDYVVAGDPAGYTLMAVGFALVVLGIAALGRGSHPRGT
jgi:hypothetical protein